MKHPAFASHAASVLWLEPHRIHASEHVRTISGLPTVDQLAQALSAMPSGPTAWILDDLMVPSVLLRDVVELPPSGDAREAFFKWKFTQSMALEGDYAVQALEIEPGLWLMAGIPHALKEEWLALALRLGRPIHSLVPRWLWLYNRLASEREFPGILLSLCPHPDGGYTGTLAAWGRTLTLLRQWNEPAGVTQWSTERLHPTVAYLQREGRTPQELWVWGAKEWPSGSVPHRVLQPEIPIQEVL